MINEILPFSKILKLRRNYHIRKVKFNGNTMMPSASSYNQPFSTYSQILIESRTQSLRRWLQLNCDEGSNSGDQKIHLGEISAESKIFENRPEKTENYSQIFAVFDDFKISAKIAYLEVKLNGKHNGVVSELLRKTVLELAPNFA